MKTKSGATAVQIVWSSRRWQRSIEHIGSAHDDAELETLRAAAAQRIAAGQLELDFGLDDPGPAGPLPITSSRTGCLLDALDRGYRVLGLDNAASGDEVFRHLVLARIIEPTSKTGSLRVLEEAGEAPPSYATLKRRLFAYAKQEGQQQLSAACAAHARLGPASLVLYDVSTLLCRCRHNRVYADLFVMPMFGCCRRSGCRAGFQDRHNLMGRSFKVLVYSEVVLCDLFTLVRREVRLRTW